MKKTFWYSAEKSATTHGNRFAAHFESTAVLKWSLVFLVIVAVARILYSFSRFVEKVTDVASVSMGNVIGATMGASAGQLLVSTASGLLQSYFGFPALPAAASAPVGGVISSFLAQNFWQVFANATVQTDGSNSFQNAAAQVYHGMAR